MKMTEYPEITAFESDNILITDGSNGTKKINAEDALWSMLNMTSPSVHRMFCRGKDLGSSVTSTQLANIQNGTFDDLWLGDYWYINGYEWVIVDFDYWYNRGGAETTAPRLTTHHAVIMPSDALYSTVMNSTKTTDGGYVGSDMYKTNLTKATSMINSAFNGAVLPHPERFVNSVTSGVPSGSVWCEPVIEIPNENMIFGHTQRSSSNYPHVANTQLAFFNQNPSKVISSAGYWLRDVVSDVAFSSVTATGLVSSNNASTEYGVRPVFAIGAIG